MGTTCPVGSSGANDAGLSDMVGNLGEWTEDCVPGDCSFRGVHGGSWRLRADLRSPDYGRAERRGDRWNTRGFRVARTLP